MARSGHVPPGERLPRLLFIVNAGWFFVSHRLPIARAARDAGYEVHVLTDASATDAALIETERLVLHQVGLERGALSLLADFRYLLQVFGVIRSVRPDVVHNVTIKPVIYGTIAARLLGVAGIVNALSGLGYSFAHRSRWVLAAMLRLAFRIVFSCPRVFVILQNSDDVSLMTAMHITTPRQTLLIRGSGVDLSEYSAVPEEPSDQPLVVLPARLLRDKGVLDFAEASALLRVRGCRARFALAGPLDGSNPAGLTRGEVEKLTAEYPVQWLGDVKDMAALYRRASIVCLPSYREGLPKALLEACASARAIVTTDVPGCREAVTHEVNGLLVPAHDPRALADALHALIRDPARRARLGTAGRRRAEEEFDVRRVIEQTLHLYTRFSGDRPGPRASQGLPAGERDPL